MTATKEYLCSLRAVRETSAEVFRYVSARGRGKYCKLDSSKLTDVVQYVLKIIDRDYGRATCEIPPHGRLQHFNVGGVDRVGELLRGWRGVDDIELSRRLVDLVVLSVLLDAGAGSQWSFREPGSGLRVGRSEGIALASFYMFKNGMLSADGSTTVNGHHLAAIPLEMFQEAFQVTEKNTIVGLEGRWRLARKLGQVMCSNSAVFGPDARPGGIVDYLRGLCGGGPLHIEQLWDTLMDNLLPVWPDNRCTIDGEPLGDAWQLDTLVSGDTAGRAHGIVSFHKLTQWLCYSVLPPLTEYGYKFDILDTDQLTGLPEYRNGGLFCDLGVISLLPEAKQYGEQMARAAGAEDVPVFPAEHGAIVEWRCLTVALIDELLSMINKELDVPLTLAQLLEAGTWKAGREVAQKKRPETGGPPIAIASDGTLF
ncbi:ABR042Wp [Eremothecium gossypii ATCC 10895]|uniref:ABR042Wp n=1 Tax=Eremothecium gossypii (strain ATCC 10895 / CBS 109.51 / FGSC 9923 / NRRL Y-1056) TaxID=284811 RepID=Q75DI3_EREGS|nr:ABR042Wp [Eremothecium gossypii ATCC 10895]AAS50812.2 ABR042Wp [Eremothecium gossypii ATCC 10895]AEY95101.1 FABR042Wp [Eremothecium gossypii FDAG1]